MEVLWLIGFSGWHAIECFTPSVVASRIQKLPISALLEQDTDLAEVEYAYKERKAAVLTLIAASDPRDAPWPPDLPRPEAALSGFSDPQHQAAFELTHLAVAFTLLHEFRHVMLDQDDQRPSDPREEEMDCDLWAREFMTANAGIYAASHNHSKQDVLSKRSMGLALAALIIYEIAPILDHGGNSQYFSVTDRLNAILNNTSLPDEDHFWIFAASLLIGIFRRRHLSIETPPLSPRDLSNDLLGKL